MWGGNGHRTVAVIIWTPQDSQALVLGVGPLHLHVVPGDLLEVPGADVADLPVDLVVPAGPRHRVGDRLAELVGASAGEGVERRHPSQAARARGGLHHRVLVLADRVVVAAVVLARLAPAHDGDDARLEIDEVQRVARGLRHRLGGDPGLELPADRRVRHAAHRRARGDQLGPTKPPVPDALAGDAVLLELRHERAGHDGLKELVEVLHHRAAGGLAPLLAPEDREHLDGGEERPVVVRQMRGRRGHVRRAVEQIGAGGLAPEAPQLVDRHGRLGIVERHDADVLARRELRAAGPGPSRGLPLRDHARLALLHRILLRAESRRCWVIPFTEGSAGWSGDPIFLRLLYRPGNVYRIDTTGLG